ncbi:hypothetical protein BDR26DRAFT_850823 [Obelidium mucronatum]|nr:hypothetical protein BDR26DRAFT_850823 [Obelidium mucronatum]
MNDRLVEFLPLSLIGVLGFTLSATIFFALARERNGALLTDNRLGWAATLLLSTTTIMSLIVGLNSAYQLFEPSYYPPICKAYGAVIGGGLAFMWGGQLLLAIQRFYLIKWNKDISQRMFWCNVGGMVVIFTAELIFSLSDPTMTISTSICQKCLIPQDHVMKLIFMSQAVSFLIVMTTIIALLYLFTFLEIRKGLAIIPNSGGASKDPQNTLKLKIHSQVLTRCVLMSSSLAVLYGPCFIILAYQSFSRTESDTVVEVFLARVWPHFDLIVTPIMILFLQQEFKDAYLRHLRWPLMSLTANKVAPSLANTGNDLDDYHYELEGIPMKK